MSYFIETRRRILSHLAGYLSYPRVNCDNPDYRLNCENREIWPDGGLMEVFVLSGGYFYEVQNTAKTPLVEPQILV